MANFSLMTPDEIPWTTECVSGPDILPWLDDAARLRITVFREWPYLYEGTLEYEREYLRSYAESPDSLFVLARVGGQVVGLSTGVPLARETEAYTQPFVAAGIDPARVFYFGESILQREYRGLGIGVRFFEERERYAREIPGIMWCAFCGVARPLDHPLRDPAYVPLDAFWRKRGYEPAGLRTIFSWQDVGESVETEKPMDFWWKKII